MFLEATEEPEGSAIILMRLGRTFLRVADAIERKVDAKLRKSGRHARLLGPIGLPPAAAAGIAGTGGREEASLSFTVEFNITSKPL
jgi:hypothetical protein